MKSKLVLYIDEDISKLLGDEESKKFKSKVSFNGKIEIDIDAADLAGLQAALNSYMNKLKVIQSIQKLDI